MKLISKELLTKNVFKLVFENEVEANYEAGQYITFRLPKSKTVKSYSIAKKDGNNFEFIIKRLEEGKGGSKEICDSEIGTDFKAFGPLGHFVLQKNTKNKLFIGTGTGFAPLYAQILEMKNSGNIPEKSKYIFGIRSFEDVFYTEELNNFVENIPGFDFQIFLSQDEKDGFTKGRVSDFIIAENISDFEEFYLCGSPAMVNEVTEKLKELGIPEENIFSEKY